MPREHAIVYDDTGEELCRLRHLRTCADALRFATWGTELREVADNRGVMNDGRTVHAITIQVDPEEETN